MRGLRLISRVPFLDAIASGLPVIDFASADGRSGSGLRGVRDPGAWTTIVEVVRWHNFDDVRGMFKDADLVDGYVIFNIRHNRYRLITVIHYAKTTDERQTRGHVYIRSFLTHKEYDNRSNWDRRYRKQ
jgi:mRNA interferase HigB